MVKLIHRSRRKATLYLKIARLSFYFRTPRRTARRGVPAIRYRCNLNVFEKKIMIKIMHDSRIREWSCASNATCKGITVAIELGHPVWQKRRVNVVKVAMNNTREISVIKFFLGDAFSWESGSSHASGKSCIY